MAKRIGKKSLDYFSHDCFQNEKLQYIVALHKSDGYMTYFRLLEQIYGGNGYYCEWSKKHLVLFANRIGLEVEIVEKIMKDILEERLFDTSILANSKVLTSSSILRRYLDGTVRRKRVEIDQNYILDENVNILIDYDNIIVLNANIITQSKVNKSKVDKTKGNESTNIPIFKEFLKFAISESKKYSYNLDQTEVQKKFDNWSGANWHTSGTNSHKITDWTVTLRNSLKYMQVSNSNQPQSSTFEKN